jgi:type IV secretion system protein TrbL
MTAPRIYRIALSGFLLLAALLGMGSPAVAAPVPDLSALPPELVKYVPGSAAWARSPWMTAPSCAGRGGDFSIWAASVLTDTPSLLAFFQPTAFGAEIPSQNRPRSDAILSGYRVLATELAPTIPAGYCVDDVRRWTGSEPVVQPFGFPWAQTESTDHETSFSCADDSSGSDADNRYFGAERAPCEGFYLSCSTITGADKARCDAWNAFSDGYVRRVQRMRSAAIEEHPATGKADTDTTLTTPGELASDLATSWFTDIARTLARGAASVLVEAMTWWTRSDRSEMAQSPAIGQIQDLLRYIGIALLLGGITWQGAVMMFRRKIDPLINAGKGLLAYVGWSTAGGTVAVVLNEAGLAVANQALGASVDGFGDRIGTALLGAAAENPAAVLLLSIVLFLLSCVQWILGFFRTGALVVLMALLPTAAAGHIGEATKPWLRKVLSWCLALILYQPLAAIIFAIGFTLIGEGQDLGTVMVGMAVLVLAVISMPTMLRFFDWGGQRLTTGGGGGGAMAVGAAASMLGSGMGGAFTQFMDRNGPASHGGETTGAAQVTPVHTGEGPASQRSGSSLAGPFGQGAGGSAVAPATGIAGGSASGAPATAATTASGAAAAGPVGAVVTAGAGAVQQGASAVAGALTDGSRAEGT